MKSGKKIVRGTGYCMGVPTYPTYQKDADIEVKTNLSDSFGEPAPLFLVQKVAEEPRHVPDFREGSIAVISEEFANGSYHRDELQVADKVIAEHFKHPR